MSIRGLYRVEDTMGMAPRFGGGGQEDIQTWVYTNLLPTYLPGFEGWAIDYIAEAAALSLGNFYEYTGETYAAQDANETDGIAAVATRGESGAQIELDGKAHLEDLYDGNKIGINPKLDAFLAAKLAELMEDLDWEILPSILNSHAFSFGGSEHNVAEAKAAALVMRKINEFARMYYGDYTHERGLQEQGMIHATPYGLQCIRDMEMLRQAGLYAREYAQGGYQDAWDSWNEAQIIPLRNLDIVGNATRTILGTVRNQMTSYYKPPKLATIAGLAITGLSLYSMFSGTSLNPYAKSAEPPTKALEGWSSLGPLE